MQNLMPKQTVAVSIIMPVYNCADKLVRAITSVRKQTYKNIQLILVDDGSRDESPALCDQSAREDSRIQVIHQKNAGASCARNRGLAQAKGEYIAFVDADDMVSDRYIEILLYAALVTNTKIVTCEALYCTGDYDADEKSDAVSPKILSVADYNFMKDWSHATVWGALFHKSVLAGLEFDPDLFVGEDSLFFAKALMRCDRVSYLSNRLYYYFMYETSLSHGSFDERRMTEFTSWKKINDLVAPRSIVLDESSKARLARHAIERYKEVLSQKQQDRNIMLVLQDIIQKNRKYYNKYQLGCKGRIEVFMITRLPKLYQAIYNAHKYCRIK